MEWLTKAFASDLDVDWLVLLERQCAAFLAGCVIAGIYRLTQGRRVSQPSSGAQPATTMMATLVLLTILIGMIGSVVGDNIARAFSLVGALSIVRFRTVVEDTRDTAFVIFAVAVGMAIGAGYFKVPLVGIPFVAAAALIFRPSVDADLSTGPQANPSWTLVLRHALPPIFPAEQPLDSTLLGEASTVSLSAVMTARQGAAIERTYILSLASPAAALRLQTALSQLPGVQHVELTRS